MNRSLSNNIYFDDGGGTYIEDGNIQCKTLICENLQSNVIDTHSDDLIDLQNQINLKANITYVDNQLLLKGDKTYIDSQDILLQNQIDTILLSPSVQTLEIGQTITLPPGSNANVVYDISSSISDIILNFEIPQGEKGDKGDRGHTGASTVEAEIAALEASASAALASLSAAASATSALEASISATEANVSYVAIQVQVDEMQGQITGLDGDVNLLTEKTQNINASVGNTQFIGNVACTNIECTNIVSNGTLYVADVITCPTSIVSPSFSGGLVPTNINGAIVNVGDGLSVINLNGLVNFTSNTFTVSGYFSQF